jgi:hypothetical protein
MKALVIAGLSIACATAPVFGSPQTGQPAGAPTKKPAGGSGEINLTATSANVGEPGSPVRIRILRWSTDEERTPLAAALTPAAPAPAPVAGATPNPPAAGAAAARGGRGPAGRGAAGRGRGGERGGRGDATPNPIAALTAAIGRAPTLGYIWTSDVTGYAIKYAWHATAPDGAERMVLATDRRLGAYSAGWQPVAAAPATDYEFTLIEIRMDPTGSGEGKASLTTKVVLDPEARIVALENYVATQVIFQHVKR